VIQLSFRSVSAIVASAAFSCTTLAGLPSGVAAGETTTNSVLLWTRSDEPGALRFDVATDADFRDIVASADCSAVDALQSVKTSITGLAAGTQHWYRAIDASGAVAVGTFRTIRDLGRTGFHMGVSGDWRGELMPLPALRNVASRDLDMFYALGDTIYADVASPAVPASQATTLAEYRAKHAETLTDRFGLNVLRDLRASTSVFAMIDDHEVTNDFAGAAPAGSDVRFGASSNGFLSGTELFRNGVQAFQEFHPIDPAVWQGTGDARTDGTASLYRTRRFGLDAQFFAVDARSYRDQELPDANPADPSTWAAYIGATYTPGRTMLGLPQLNRLMGDLAQAQASGVTWKFVMMPEPIQNLGVLAASDRYEGYAYERAMLLGFIKQAGIQNVVFISADIHGTLVNNLTFPGGPGGSQVQSGAWEISTGSGAYAAPFGPTVAGLAAALGLPGTLPLSYYLSLPAVHQEAYITGLLNAQITPFGYDPIGLAGSGIPFKQLVGGPTATNSFGWTEFEVDQVTQRLTVTTWGTPWYDESFLLANPFIVAAMQPQVLQRFTVDALPTPCAGDLDHSGAVDAGDVSLLLIDFGACSGCDSDLDQNGVTDGSDLALMLLDLGPCTP
jgi:3-phytase/alkaline phosphatase D